MSWTVFSYFFILPKSQRKSCLKMFLSSYNRSFLYACSLERKREIKIAENNCPRSIQSLNIPSFNCSYIQWLQIITTVNSSLSAMAEIVMNFVCDPINLKLWRNCSAVPRFQLSLHTMTWNNSNLTVYCQQLQWLCQTGWNSNTVCQPVRFNQLSASSLFTHPFSS